MPFAALVPRAAAPVQQAIRGMLVAVDALTSFSVVVGAIGLAGTPGIAVLQCRRELGTLGAVLLGVAASTAPAGEPAASPRRWR